MMEDQMDDESGDREISLSPGIVLGVFLALALVCAVFFGFGYSVGRRSAAAPIPATEAQTGPIVGTGGKPSPGSLAGVGRSGKNAAVPADESPTESSAEESGARVSSPEKPAAQRSASASAGGSNNVTTSMAPAGVARSTTTFRVPAVVTPPSASSASGVAGAGGGSIVQVAAFSHQQDAELVAGALRKRGYDVTIRQQPQDSLLHVQLGPFASKKEADAMRQRLQADGYNAIVK